MKICIATVYFGRIEGGAEISTHSLANELFKKGHDVVIIRTDTENVNVPFRIITLPFLTHIPINYKAVCLHMQWAEELLVRKLRRVFDKESFDLILVPDIMLLRAVQRSTISSNVLPFVRDWRFLCNLPNVNNRVPLKIHMSAKEYRIKLFEFAGLWKGMILYLLIYKRPQLLQEGLFRCKKVIAVSDFVKQQLIAIGISPQNVIVVVEAAPSWKRIIMPKHKVFTLLCVGRLEEYKGFRLVLEAMNAVAKNYSLKLIIAGIGPDEQYLKSSVQRYSLENVVEFRGWVCKEDLSKLYASCDVFIFPSLWPEPFGIVPLEAMAMGKPVIATNVGAIPSVVTKETGILVEPGNLWAMVNSIQYYILHPEKCKKAGKLAFERSKLFTTEKQISSILTFFRKR